MEIEAASRAQRCGIAEGNGGTEKAAVGPRRIDLRPGGGTVKGWGWHNKAVERRMAHEVEEHRNDQV
jgi:hypothetical protein